MVTTTSERPTVAKLLERLEAQERRVAALEAALAQSVDSLRDLSRRANAAVPRPTLDSKAAKREARRRPRTDNPNSATYWLYKLADSRGEHIDATRGALARNAAFAPLRAAAEQAETFLTSRLDMLQWLAAPAKGRARSRYADLREGVPLAELV